MRVLELAKRNFKEILRDRILMAFLIGMPVIFMLIFGFAFRDVGTEPLTIGIVDQDQTPISQQFVGALNQISALNVSNYGEKDVAREALRLGDLNGVLVIPNGFGSEVQTGAQTQLALLYDQSELMMKERFVSIITSAAIAFAGTTIPVSVEAKGIQAADIGYMNILGPGMTVFGLMILIPTAAASIARDKELEVMPRLLTTPLRPWQFIAGYSLPYIPMLIIQIVLYLGIAYALGLRILGNFGLVLMVLFVLGLSCLAIGMIWGSIIKRESQAHVSWIIIVPMALLSGAWFETGGMPSVMQGISKAFPATYAISAAQDVISRGLGFGAIANDFYILLGFAVGLFAIGAILFRRTMKA